MISIKEELELKQAILDLLAKRGNRVLAPKEIHERVAEIHSTREESDAAIADLEADGKIIAVRGKRYSLLEFTPYVAGNIKVHPDGYGIVYTQDENESDYYVDRRAMRGAMNGDLVLLRFERERKKWKKLRGKRFLEAEVSRILRRENRTVVGRFHATATPFVVPFDIRLDVDILIDAERTMDAKDGEMVNVEIEKYGDRASGPTGRVIEVLGFIGDPGVDIEVVIRKYRIPHRFPDDVVDAAEKIPLEVSPDEMGKRVDLRDHTIVTIDGETAKDFDDAVEVVDLGSGRYRLGVHIADVAHYIAEGSVLDQEALERGTSVYFPGRAVPMLPERLSNGICSLNPRVDRLTFSVSIDVDKSGRVVDRKVFKSLIRTKERMTYTDVNAILTEPTPELLHRYEPLLDDFSRMHELYQILRKRREARGSIDFDLPEADVLLGEAGEIESIQPTSRNVAHRIIEEFMLLANEVIAQELTFAGQPAIYRIHSAPDSQKISDMKEVLKEFKYRLRGDPEEIRPGELQRVLKDVEGKPEERFITELVLRSMKRALYAEESTGHFALALEYYCHFTSPIRRYPDLIVHRRLAELLEQGAMHGKRRDEIEASMPVIASQSSEREKRAEDAEREVTEWKKVIFMRDKVGQSFSGFITGVMPFGLFVELDEIFVQGLVPVATIGGDYWTFAEREHRLRGAESGREFRLGDHVVVEVHSLDEDRRQIEFRLLEAGGVAASERDRKPLRNR